MSIKARSCEVYFDGELLGEAKAIEVEPFPEISFPVYKRVNTIASGGVISGTLNITDRLAFLSLIYCRKVTNNWLKMHGGVMVRRGGKRKRGRR